MIRSRFGIALLAALGVAAATVAGGTLHTTAHHGITARADRDVLTANFTPQFGNTAGSPNNQIESVTVYNTNAIGQGQSVPVLGVSVAVTNPPGVANPWRIAPNEDCTGATIAPQGYCVVSLTFNPEQIPAGTDLTGEVSFTLGDKTVFTHFISATTEPDVEVPPTNPHLINYGNVPVGTTTAPHTVTLQRADFELMIMSVLSVAQPQQPNAAADYRPATDTCTGTKLGISPDAQSCAIGVTATPAAAGNRPALLDIAYCNPNDFPNISDSPGTPNQPPPPGVPPGQELVCGEGDGFPILAQHILVTLTANGVPPTTGTPPNQTFTPTLTDVPAVAPGGRTTLVGGAGFPANTAVILALVPLDTPTTANLAAVPGSVTVTTDGAGGFANQIMLIMPHTAPGQYVIMGAAGTANATVPFLVAPGIQEPPKFVMRH